MSILKQFWLAIIVICAGQAMAGGPPDEGMWLPSLVQKLNYTQMQKMGLTIGPDAIYNVNQPSLKDAVVGLVESGSQNVDVECTAEVVSPNGLLFTNHHCGYAALQSQSTLEYNILKEGFWAKSHEEEIPNIGLQVCFLVRMEDVSSKVLEGIDDSMGEKVRNQRIAEAKQEIIERENENGRYTAEVKSMFKGNAYFLFVYQIFKDVRLVGAPPNSIGEFGGETDNWMWPRHTGDFCIFRIYASPEGNPADYSPVNIPLSTPTFLKISLDGYKEGDFTMVMGYPGSSDRFLPAEGIRIETDLINPVLIKNYGKILEIWKSDMEANNEVEIKYSAKYDQYANAWKNYVGANKGVKKLGLTERKKKGENDFRKWANQSPESKLKYGSLIGELDSANKEIREIIPEVYSLSAGILRGIEILDFAKEFYTVYNVLKEFGNLGAPFVQGNIQELKEKSRKFYKNYHAQTDVKVFAAIFELNRKELQGPGFEDIYKEIDTKYKGNYERWAEKLFSKSLFSSQEKLEKFLENPRAGKITNDPLMELVVDIFVEMLYVTDRYDVLQKNISRLERKYVEGQREMIHESAFYPDANGTLRFTYGRVNAYKPADAVQYAYRTTLDGMFAKEDSLNEEFVIPARLKYLYNLKDYGPYADRDVMPLCFLTDNDISGGNSGSPVMNANGELIGIAFDGNWEAMSSDLAYEPEIQRALCVDIRFVLFIIDKYAGAGNIIQELSLR
jgi:hypothetical protein